MDPIDFEEKSNTLNANHEDGFKPLPVLRGKFDDGTRFFVSKWKPTPEEIQQIVDGSPIWLVLWSYSHPPVRLTTELPPECAHPSS